MHEVPSDRLKYPTKWGPKDDLKAIVIQYKEPPIPIVRLSQPYTATASLSIAVDTKGYLKDEGGTEGGIHFRRNYNC